MRNSIKTILIVLGLLAFSPAFASTLGQTTDHSTIENATPDQQTWVFTPDATQTVNRITLWTDTTYSGTQSLEILNSAGSTIATGTATVLNGATTFIFPTDVVLTAGSKYALYAQTFLFYGAPYNGATDYDTKGCKEYLYTLGNALGTCGSGNTQIKADPYVTFSWVYTFNAPTLALTYPASQVSQGDDFSHFQVLLTTNSAVSGQVSVNYGLQTASTTYTGTDFGGSYPSNGSTTVYVPKTVPLSGLQWAQGVFKDLSGSVLATSSIVYWSNQGYTMTYSGASAVNTIAPTSTTGLLLNPDDPNSFWYVDCSAYSTWDPAGWFCSSKKAGLWLVYNLAVPHQAFNGFWQWGLNLFRGAFPFNVGFGFIDTLNGTLHNVQYASADLYLPIFNTNIKVFDQTKIRAIMGSGNFDLLYGTEQAIIWILLGLGIYFEVKLLLKRK